MTELLKSEIKRIADITENNLRTVISGYRNNPLYAEELSGVIDSAEYSLLAGGKRLRPFLVHSFCSMCQGKEEDALAPASAIEMLHTYSLIHDDLPCMDNDDYRRGKPTNHKVFGEATAVLTGDGLLTEAFSVICNSSLSNDIKVKLVSVLSSRAGLLGMIGGQEIDLKSEGVNISQETLLTLQRKKTGMLFEAASQMGCIASGNYSDSLLSAASSFAHSFGLAFQITDDILDVTGSSEIIGKNVGSDAKECKYTFVTHLGIEGAKKEAKSQIESAKSILVDFFGRKESSALTDLCDYIIYRDK